MAGLGMGSRLAAANVAVAALCYAATPLVLVWRSEAVPDFCR